MQQDIREAIERLSDGDVLCRRRAAEKLLTIGAQARSAAVALVRAAADADETVREAVVGALESLGEPEEQDIAELAGLLESEFADTAYWAATLLGRAGTKAASAADALARSLVASVALEVRQRIAWALGLIKCSTPAVLQSLEGAAVSDDSRLARISLQSLEQIRAG